MKILVINPGSTSTKMAVFDDETSVLVRNIVHSPDDLAGFDDIEFLEFKADFLGVGARTGEVGGGTGEVTVGDDLVVILDDRTH